MASDLPTAVANPLQDIHLLSLQWFTLHGSSNKLTGPVAFPNPMQVPLSQGPFLWSPGQLATNVVLSTVGKDPQTDERSNHSRLEGGRFNKQRELPGHPVV